MVIKSETALSIHVAFGTGAACNQIFQIFLLEILSEISGWVALKILSRPKQTPLKANFSLQRVSLLPRASPQKPFSAAFVVLMWREGLGEQKPSQRTSCTA